MSELSRQVKELERTPRSGSREREGRRLEMPKTPTQKQGNIARPVWTKGGVRPDRSGDGVGVIPKPRPTKKS